MSGDIPPTRRGYDAREVTSSLQKSIRRSDPDQAVYWAVEMARSGYGNWFWKRARVIAVEDCSPEATGLVADVFALSEQWKAAQKNHGDGHENLYVVRAAISLAIAPKSRVTDWSLLHHASDRVERREVPDHAIDKHTLRGKQMGRGMEHFIQEAALLEPWTGSLDELEAEYREHALRLLARDDDAKSPPPPNPWQSPPSEEPAQNSQRHGSGQLRIRSDR